MTNAATLASGELNPMIRLSSIDTFRNVDIKSNIVTFGGFRATHIGRTNTSTNRFQRTGLSVPHPFNPFLFRSKISAGVNGLLSLICL